MPNLSSEQTLFWKMPFLMTAVMFFFLFLGAVRCPAFDPEGLSHVCRSSSSERLKKPPSPFHGYVTCATEAKVQFVLQTVSQFA